MSKIKADESREDFMERCIAEALEDGTADDRDDAATMCADQWDEESGEKRSPPVIRKTHSSTPGHNLEFILSDATPDRYQDVIVADGWDLKNFKKNPIALFNHKADFPVGAWENLRVVKGELRGNLRLAPEGTSPRIDEIRRLVEANILRAVSVGFRPIESKPRGKTEPGELFLKSELVETSLVSVPANPNALAVAKSLNVSDDTIALVFAKHGKDGEGVRRRSAAPGKHAVIPPHRKSNQMTTITERIQAAQEAYNAKKAELQNHLDSMDDTNVSEEQLTKTRDLNQDLKQKSDVVASLTDAEKALSSTATAVVPVQPREHQPVELRAAPQNYGPRPFAVAAKKVEPIDLFFRAAAIKVLSHQTKVDASIIRQKIYGDDLPTKLVTDLVLRAASAPADTTTAGWAAELVQTINAGFMETLAPDSVYPRLSAMGLRLSFGRNGVISIPTRSATPTIAGSFVAEGAPIPVRQGAFTAATLTPKKLAVISTMTREISEHSIPAIEGLIRDAIQEDTAVAIDTVLLDAVAASAVRPAGLLNGVAAITATTGGGLAALVTDIGLISGALITATGGRVRNPVWIMNPQSANAISLLSNGLGLFPFREEINSNRLNRYPVIVSGTVAAGVVILVDAADFVSVSGDDPRFDVSDQATLHMEDTTPLAIGVAGSPATVAAPVRSLWQTDSLGIRMILPMNWTLRRTGIVRWTTAVSWD